MQRASFSVYLVALSLLGLPTLPATAFGAPVDDLIAGAKKEGVLELYAPSVISPAYNAGVIKGAPHPSVGHLFSAFLTSPPAQEILQKFGGHTSAFVPGTPAYKFVQGRNTIYMKQEHAEMVDRLTAVYGKIFGLQ